MKLKSIILGLVIIIFIVCFSPTVFGAKEGLKSTCKSATIINCGEKCTKGCTEDESGPIAVFDKCIEEACEDSWTKNSLKNCARRNCNKGCSGAFKSCVEKIMPSKPVHSGGGVTAGWKFVGGNQNCTNATPRNFLGSVKSSNFKDLVRTCENSPGCSYIVRDANHGNLYKVCETKPHNGLDIWKKTGGPTKAPAPHKIGGVARYEQQIGKTTQAAALEPNPWAMGVTVDQCKNFCNNHEECSCAVYKKTKSGPFCSLRKGSCGSLGSGPSDVYIKKISAPLEAERPKNMQKLGEGSCKFGGQNNYVGKGYMPPQKCLEMCSKDKSCQGASFSKMKANSAECINIIGEASNYGVNKNDGGYCYKKLQDIDPIPNCQDQLGNECQKCNSGYKLSDLGKKGGIQFSSIKEGFDKPPVCQKIEEKSGILGSAASSAAKLGGAAAGRGAAARGAAAGHGSAAAGHGGDKKGMQHPQMHQQIHPHIHSDKDFVPVFDPTAPPGLDSPLKKNSIEESEKCKVAAKCKLGDKKGLSDCHKKAIALSVPAKNKHDPISPANIKEEPEGICNQESCCAKDQEAEPVLHFMRPHKHKMNSKVMDGLSGVNNLFQEWYEKMKPLPKKEPEAPDHRFLKEESGKLDGILARIKDSEMRKNIKKKKKGAFPIDLDVVLNDDSDIKNAAMKGNLSKKEGFANPPSRNPAWGYGPNSVNKVESITIL